TVYGGHHEYGKVRLEGNGRGPVHRPRTAETQRLVRRPRAGGHGGDDEVAETAPAQDPSARRGRDGDRRGGDARHGDAHAACVGGRHRGDDDGDPQGACPEGRVERQRRV